MLSAAGVLPLGGGVSGRFTLLYSNK